jgi:lipoprotein-releasing system permease protein
MSWIYFLTRKYRGTRRKRGIRLVWHLAVIGVAFGVATLLLTQAVLSGSEKVFRKSILGFNAHLVVMRFEDMDKPAAEETRIREFYPGEIQAATPFFYREGLFVSKGKVKGAVLKGIDPLTFEKVYAVEVRSWREPQAHARIEDLLKSPDRVPHVILGSDLAEELGIRGPETVVRVFLPQRVSEKAAPGADAFQEFRVAGTFISGLREFDEGFAFMESRRLQEIYGVSDSATGLEFRLQNPMDAESLAQDLKPRLGPGYQVISWQKLNQPLFQALRLERSMFFVIMSMVVAVAAFNIVGVLLLMIFDKSREISILRALGSPYGGLKRLFGMQGLWIGALGCFWGVVLGGSLAWLLKVSRILKLAKEVYFIGELPVDLSLWVIVTVAGISLLIAYLATQFAVARLKRSPLDL